MIREFADDQTRRLFETGVRKGWGPSLCRSAVRKLLQLNQARKPEDMRAPPGNKLHPLLGNRKGQWAVWVNDQYRLCFRFDGEDAVDVEDHRLS
ncbi:MAG TPA: type II toxin-antitoxin system RelE/ParE family toxin [Rhizobiaceae bacterium]|nr:type II toxin-antitoxin system RelE/ParE family toxin [Rhizobiaceae bacterium]